MRRFFSHLDRWTRDDRVQLAIEILTRVLVAVLFG